MITFAANIVATTKRYWRLQTVSAQIAFVFFYEFCQFFSFRKAETFQLFREVIHPIEAISVIIIKNTISTWIRARRVSRFGCTNLMDSSIIANFVSYAKPSLHAELAYSPACERSDQRIRGQTERERERKRFI